MFGDFLNNGKHRQLDIEDIDDLEDGTPIVARYNNREFRPIPVKMLVVYLSGQMCEK